RRRLRSAPAAARPGRWPRRLSSCGLPARSSAVVTAAPCSWWWFGGTSRTASTRRDSPPPSPREPGCCHAGELAGYPGAPRVHGAALDRPRWHSRGAAAIPAGRHVAARTGLARRPERRRADVLDRIPRDRGETRRVAGHRADGARDRPGHLHGRDLDALSGT